MSALISTIIFLPTVIALGLGFMPNKKDEDGVNDPANKNLFLGITLVTSIVVMLLTFVLWTSFDSGSGEIQMAENLAWIPSFDISYLMGLDGISLPLVLLTSVVSVLSIGASWSINKHVKAYCVLFLLLMTGMLGVFMALDFFLFYIFWEVMLLPMYFLIGIWGGPRREYAAIKFFIYTLVGGVLMLIAILMLYFSSDVTELAQHIEGDVTAEVVQAELGNLHLHETTYVAIADNVNNAAAGEAVDPIHTFNLRALASIGQTTEQFSVTLQRWAFLLLFIGFIIKVPSIPVHTWLPDAHVEAPTPISMILAGVLLKMGGYGIIRICYPICPHGGYDLAYLVCFLGVASMLYGAFAALAQTDFKRLVAYSSVSHMGYVVLGMGVWSIYAPEYNGDYWAMGITGAMYQMIGHGISSAGMFFMVGIIYDRVHHRNLAEFGGLYGKMPRYTALAMGLFFAGLGLPGLCGFIGEVLVVLSVWNFSKWLAILSAAVVILTAAYILWCLQRVYLGPQYNGPHEEEIKPINSREFAIGGTLLGLAIIFGVFPNILISRMDDTIKAQVSDLNTWTQEVKLANAEDAEEADEAEAVADDEGHAEEADHGDSHDTEDAADGEAEDAVEASNADRSEPAIEQLSALAP